MCVNLQLYPGRLVVSPNFSFQQDAVADVTNATVLETNTGTSPATVTDTGSSAGMAGGNTSIAGNTTVATAAAVDADAAGNVTDGWTTAADGDSVTTAENITDGMNTNVTSVVATTPVPESNATTEGGNLQTTAQEATTAAPIIYSCRYFVTCHINVL